MKLLIQKIKDVKLIEHPFLLAIILNIAYLIGMLLLYKPFLSPDDYMMSETVYGVFGDDYDCHVKYMNFNYGRLMVLLLRLFPDIPWYTILFYIWVFLSLTIVSKIILDKFPKNISLLIVNVVLLYFSYEGYVCILFTKVAGITGAAGAMAILLSSSWLELLLGIGLFVISMLVRYDMTKMVIGSFFAMLVVALLIELSSRGKIQWDKKIYFRMGIVAILFFVVPKIPSYDTSEKMYWDYYWQCNSNRSFIQDYALPDYEEFRDIYEILDISQNDIYLWKSWNSDGQAMTTERINVLRKMNSGKISSKNQISNYKFKDKDIRLDYQNYIVDSQEDNGETKIVSYGFNNHVTELFYKYIQPYLQPEDIISFFKEFPKSFLKIDVAFVYFVCVILILIGSKNDNEYSKIAVIVSFFIGLLLNYYLYVHDRYLQHRVDVGIFFTLICICIILYRIQIIEMIEEKSNFVQGIIAVVSVVMLITPYKIYGDDCCPYTTEKLAQNRNLIEYMTKQDENCYVLAATMNEGSLWYRFYDTFVVPQKHNRKNIFCGYGIGNIERYAEYGIDYIYSDIVDNQYIYLVLSDDDTNQLAWEEYISKHSGTTVHLKLQRNIYGAKFYSLKSDSMLINE